MPPPYDDVEIHIRERKERGYRIDLRLNGLPCLGQGTLDPNFSWIPGADPEADGERLFGWLLADPDLRGAWSSMQPHRRIRLHVDAEAPKLHQIPWELLREPATPTSTALDLAASALTPFSRFLAVKGKPPKPLPRQQLKVLVVIASPSNLNEYGLEPIAVDQEWASLRAVFGGMNVICDQLREPCTLPSLEQKLSEGYHILHIMAHGAYDVSSAKAVLMLADQQNYVSKVTDQEIASLFMRLGAGNETDVPHLVFLASCQSATGSSADAFSALAPQIVRSGVPFVVAMQEQIPVDTARQFATTFFDQVFNHGIVDLAGNQARSHVISARLPGASCPVLFMRSLSGQLFAQAVEEKEKDEGQVRWTVNYRYNEHFVGREDELVRLHGALAAGPVGLTGLGGVGKTGLAVAYCYRYESSYPGGVFWIDAAAPLETGFAIQGAARNQKRPHDATSNDAYEFAAYLKRHSDALLVVDNLSDPTSLKLAVLSGVIPAQLPCKLLFTTRASGNHRFTLIEVTMLGEDEALQLLLKAGDRAAILEKSHPEHNDAKAICRALGYLPLALELAAAYLGKQPKAKLGDYRRDLARRSPLLVVDDPRAKVRSVDLATLHRAAVRATFAEQVKTLSKDNKSRQVLKVAGQLPALASLPNAWLGLLAGLSDQDDGGFLSDLDLAVDELTAVSLVKRLEPDAVNLHPLVHEFAVLLTPKNKRHGFRERSAAHAVASLAEVDRPADWPITVGQCLLAFGWADLPQERRVPVLEAVRQVMTSSSDESIARRAAFLLKRMGWLRVSGVASIDEMLIYLNLIASYAATDPDRQDLVEFISPVLDARDLDPMQEAQLRVYRGAMLGGIGRLEDAARDYDRASFLIGDTSTPSKLAVRIYLGSGGIAQRKAEALPQRDPTRQGFLLQAKRSYERAAQLVETRPLGPVLTLTIHKELGYVEGLLGNWQEADEHLNLAFEALTRITDATTQLTYWARVVDTAANIKWLVGEERAAKGDIEGAYGNYRDAFRRVHGIVTKLQELSEELDVLPYAFCNCGKYLLSMSQIPGDQSSTELKLAACEHWKQALEVAKRLGVSEAEQEARERLNQHCTGHLGTTQ